MKSRLESSVPVVESPGEMVLDEGPRKGTTPALAAPIAYGVCVCLVAAAAAVLVFVDTPRERRANAPRPATEVRDTPATPASE
jgi:hypothetical protein